MPPSSLSTRSSDTVSSNQEDACQQDVTAATALPNDVQHVLWMSFEHEAMHLETLMYLLVQYEAVQPPPPDLTPASLAPGVWRSDLAAAAAAAGAAAVSVCSAMGAAGKGCMPGLLPLPPAAAWVDVPTCNITLGVTQQPSTSSSSGSQAGLQFGWDNECPAREVSVAGFKMQHRPVTVLEYLQYVAHRLAEIWVDLGRPAAAPSCSPAPAGCQADNADALVSVYNMQTDSEGRATATSSSSSSGSRQHRKDDAIAASSTSLSSNSLPRLLSDIRALSLQWQSTNQQQQPCGCLGVLLQLLQAPSAQSILPASLAMPHSSSSSSRRAAPTGQPNLLLSPAASSCCGLCMLAAPSASDSSNSSSSACAKTAHPETGRQHAEVQGALLDALQLTLGVKTAFGTAAPISVAGYWPVYCSALQAEQYTAWLASHADGAAQSCRLPTEPEVLAARQHTAASLLRKSCAVGEGELLPQGADFSVWHPLCVQLQAADKEAAGPAEPSALGHNSSSSSSSGGSSSSSSAADCRALLPVSQLCGNGWEWTCTPFGRHEGFQPHPLYPEYSQV